MGSKLIISVILVLLDLSTSTLALSAAIDNMHYQSNSNYTAFIGPDKCLVVLDNNTNKTTQIKIDALIHRLEICPTAPYVSFVGAKTQDGVLRDTRFYIYDIHTGKLYDGQYFLDLSETRWSPSGKYTYFNMVERLILVPTDHLTKWLESSEYAENIHKIIGHPLGYMWQVAWVGDNLLYGNGIGEMECWGLLNTSNGSNKFISCCGIASDAPCDANSRGDIEIIKTLALGAQEGTLQDISNDFFEEVQRITTSGGKGKRP